MGYALAAMIEEQPDQRSEPRLYSRGHRDRTPVDVVLPQHADIHALLIRWGAWNASRAARRGAASVEGLYSKVGTPPATAPLAADRQIVDLERAMVAMPAEQKDTLRRLYVFRMTPISICQLRRPRMRYEAWAEHIATCRSMALNLLRRIVV